MNETFPNIEAIQETSQNAKKCCEKLSSRALEINLIVFNSISFAILLIFIIFMKTDVIVYIDSIFFFMIFMLIIIVIILIFSSLLRHWRSKNLIKIDKKKCATILISYASMFSTFFLFLCIAEKFLDEYYELCSRTCSWCISGASDTSDTSDYFCFKIYYNKTHIRIIHTIFSLIEIWSIFQICILIILAKRIDSGLDEPRNFIELGIQTISNESIIKQENIPISSGETFDDSQANIEIKCNNGKNIDDKNKKQKEIYQN